MDPKARRQPLLDAMESAKNSGIHCGSCEGTCCTYAANSMQIDETQALEMKRWLEAQGRWNDQLFEKLKECVDEFRLDREISNVRIRRSYTCPFYTGAKLGCSIAPEVKPYGCLAFNPRVGGLTHGGNCSSNRELLEQTGDQPAGEKRPIPVALLLLR